MTEAANEKTLVNLKLSVDLDEHLTWGELFRFVDLARSVVDSEGTVAIQYDEQDMKPEALYVYLPAENLPSPGA